MLDLKSCPFCGGEATHRRFTGNGFTLARVEYTQVSCQKCRIETEPDQPLGNEDRAATAWNRRTLQAVGPEPTVAVKPLEWEGDFAHTRFGLFYHVNHATGTPGYVVLEKHEGSATSKSSWDTVADAQVAAEADYASRIRSALVATPPAEQVAEALRAKVEEIRKRVGKTICPTFSSDGGDQGEQGRISRCDFDTLVLAALAAKDGRHG